MSQYLYKSFECKRRHIDKYTTVYDDDVKLKLNIGIAFMF